MDIRQVTPDYSVSPQISASDVPAIAAAGFRSIICNRPDAEHPGDMPADQVKAAAEKAGLQFRYVPVVSGQITPNNVADHAAALKSLPGPVLAYCRSGARSTNLFGMAQQRR